MKSQMSIPIGGRIQPCRPITSIVGTYNLKTVMDYITFLREDIWGVYVTVGNSCGNLEPPVNFVYPLRARQYPPLYLGEI